MTIAIRPTLTVEMCRELFAYEPKSGLLTWRKAVGNRRTIGRIVGQMNRGGYRHVPFNGQSYMVHHIIWAMEYGRWPEKMLDHIDGNKLNNRLENLREVTAAENAHNRGTSKNNKCGLKGVSWHKASGSWTAGIMANGKNHYLGLFATKEDAAKAYDAAASELHGDFAVTNAMIIAAKHRPVPRAEPGENIRMFDPAHLGGKRTW